jgi:hypothetical protein
MPNLAPIVLFVYNRPEHTKETLENLKNNYLALQSDLYIFSDGAKDLKQDANVKEVRKIINKLDGFNMVKIFQADSNKGLANSVIDGVNKIINEYGKVIVLEDDLITSPYFLTYMNNGLNIYKGNGNIWSLSGFTPDISIDSSYGSEVYLSRRGCSWGWATWKDRWNTVDWEITDYPQFRKSPQQRREFNKGGSDLSYMLDDQFFNRIDSWAIRWVYSQFKQSKYTIYPTKSLVINNGMDFSGTHSSKSDRYLVKLYTENFTFPEVLNLNNQILANFKNFYNLSLLGYIGVFSRRCGFYRPLKKLRKHLFNFGLD